MIARQSAGVEVPEGTGFCRKVANKLPNSLEDSAIETPSVADSDRMLGGVVHRMFGIE